MEWLLMGTEFLFEMMKKFWNGTMVMVYNSVNVIKATKLYTLK